MAGPLNIARLTLEADADNDGSDETGVFEFASKDVSPGVRTGFLIEDRGSTVNSILSELIDDGVLSDTNKRRGFYLDFGGGQHSVEIDFDNWTGAEDPETGDPLQWGDDPTVGRSQSSATGQRPITQIDVLTRYIIVGEYDSLKPATFEYGEFSSAGLYDPLDVILEGPRQTRSNDQRGTYAGTMTLIAAADLRDYLDAQQKLDY